MKDDYKLIEASTPEEWDFVHMLRNEELFKRRNVTYNPDHPANFAPHRYTYILKYKNMPIATASLDVLEGKAGVLRLVAVLKEEQRKGHGKVLEELFEKIATSKGIEKLFVNASKAALGFYEKLGYHYETWSDPEMTNPGDHYLQMSKSIV